MGDIWLVWLVWSRATAREILKFKSRGRVARDHILPAAVGCAVARRAGGPAMHVADAGILLVHRHHANLPDPRSRSCCCRSWDHWESA